MARRDLFVSGVDRRATSAPVQNPHKGIDTISMPEKVQNFLQSIDADHPELLYQALRSQSYDFVTALLDKLEVALSGQYVHLNFPVLRILVGEFGWHFVPLYPSQDVEFPGQAYILQRPSLERETKSWEQAWQTQNLGRPRLTKYMAMVMEEAREFLAVYLFNDAEIIHALETRTEEFAEALFDLLEEETRSVWVSPRRPLIRHLLEVVGWQSGPTTGGRFPHSIMIKPSHHTVELSPGGMWVATSWISRARARRAWESGEIGEGETHQSWYQAQFRAQEARAEKAWAEAARTKQARIELARHQRLARSADQGAGVRSRPSHVSIRQKGARHQAPSHDDTCPSYDAVLGKLCESRTKMEGELENVREMQTRLWQEASKIRKRLRHVDEHMAQVKRIKFGKSRIPQPLYHSGGSRRLYIQR